MKRITIFLALPALLLTFISQVWAVPTPSKPEWHLVGHTFTAPQPVVQVGDVVTTLWAVPVDHLVNDGLFYLAFTTQTGEILMDADYPLTFPPPGAGGTYHFQCGQNDPTHEVRCLGAGSEPDSVAIVVKFETEVTACLEGKVISEGFAVRLLNGQTIYEPIDSLTLPCRSDN